MVSAGIIQGTPYSCESDASILALKKLTLDTALKSSTITPAKLKEIQDDYNSSKAKYEASDCGKDTARDKCLSYQAQLGSLRSSISYSIATRDNEHANVLKGRLEELMKKYKDLNCDAKISEFRGGVVMSIADVYQQMDKERIEAESKYQLKQRLFFGAIVVFGALLMVTTFSKKN